LKCDEDKDKRNHTFNKDKSRMLKRLKTPT